VSPDARSVVRLVRLDEPPAGSRYDDQAYALAVTDIVAKRTEIVAIDRTRMRFPSVETLDPGWIAHHFAWVRDADGADRLRERPGFVPLAHRGTFIPQSRFYSVQPAGAALRDALVELLVAELGAERLSSPEYSDSRRLQVDGAILGVGATDHYSPFVSISLEGSAPDPRGVMPRVVRHVDAALATRRYDALFGWGSAGATP
jgi:hypothetical protein